MVINSSEYQILKCCRIIVRPLVSFTNMNVGVSLTESGTMSFDHRTAAFRGSQVWFNQLPKKTYLSHTSSGICLP